MKLYRTVGRFSWVIKKKRMPGKEWPHNRERFWIGRSFVAFKTESSRECWIHESFMCGETSQQPVVTATSLPRLVPGAGFSIRCNRPSGLTDFRNSGSNNYLLKKDHTACSYHVMSIIYNIYTIFSYTERCNIKVNVGPTKHVYLFTVG